jgi:hypothetical protein
MEAKEKMHEESEDLLENESTYFGVSMHWIPPWHTYFSDTFEDTFKGPEILGILPSRNCSKNMANKLESSEREVVEPRIWLETLYKYDIRAWRVERMMHLLIVEKDNSFIWGEDENMELIRLPKRYERVLIQGKDKVLTFFSDGPDQAIENKVLQIHRRFRLLEQERDYMIKELERSLYCMSFSGDCRYLGI